jgi:environmental stress-induced protein Ves
MTQLTVLRAVDYVRMPWKNGGGSTEEITRDSGDGLDGFGWRLSIADIVESGGFSVFAGYLRIITVLQGAGMTLNIDGQDSEPLLVSDPFAFSGDSQVSCTLVDGPIRDFNLIYSPNRYRARLQWIDVLQPQRFFSSANVFLVFSAAEQMAANVGEHPPQLLERHDCLQLDNTEGALLEVVLYAPRASRCCVLELTAI